MKNAYCQSCAMPMKAEEELYGTNADGSNNKDYCKYCFNNGNFTANITMNEMIEFCMPHMAAANPGMSQQDAQKTMQEIFPLLKRWRKNQSPA